MKASLKQHLPESEAFKEPTYPISINMSFMPSDNTAEKTDGRVCVLKTIFVYITSIS